MAEIAPGPDNDYQAQSTTTFSRAVWNAVMASIAARLKARELLEATFETLIENGTQAALDMISQNVAPQLSALTTQINDLEDALEDLIGGGTAPNALQLGGQNPAYYLALANATGTLPVAQVSGVEALISAAVAGLVNSAPTTLDTLKELSDALGGDANFATHMAEALGFRLRVDAAQSFTTEQKAQAFSNLGFTPGDYYTKTQVYTKGETDTKLGTKLNTTGGTITEDLTLIRSGSPTTGALFMGNSGHRLYFDGTRFDIDVGLKMASDLVINNGSPTINLRDTDGFGVFLHNNGNTLYFLRGATANAETWDSGPNSRHPLSLDLATGHWSISGDLYALANLYAGGARLSGDGNVYGTTWSGWLSNHIESRAAAFADDRAANKIFSLRWSGGGDVGYSSGNWMGGGSGEVIKGLHSSPAVAGGVDSVRIRYLQYVTASGGWVTVGDG